MTLLSSIPTDSVASRLLAMRAIGIQIKFSESGDESQLDPDERAELNDNIRDTPPNSYLRCSKKVLAAVEGKDLSASDPMTKVRATMAQRLRDGYSLVRYRVQIGEETIGLFRGPLLPSYPGNPPDKWPYSSNNGQDYQIFDMTLGMMNISYSSAWNLGRVRCLSFQLPLYPPPLPNSTKNMNQY